MNRDIYLSVSFFQLILICVIFFSCFVLLPHLAMAQNIRHALVNAYNNNPELRAERARLRAIDEEVSQALSNWRPNVSISGDVSRDDTFDSSRAGDNSNAKDQIRTPRGVKFEITQPLFRGFRTIAATRKAKNNVNAARSRLHSVEQSVLLSGAMTSELSLAASSRTDFIVKMSSV